MYGNCIVSRSAKPRKKHPQQSECAGDCRCLSYTRAQKDKSAKRRRTQTESLSSLSITPHRFTPEPRCLQRKPVNLIPGPRFTMALLSSNTELPKKRCLGCRCKRSLRQLSRSTLPDIFVLVLVPFQEETLQTHRVHRWRTCPPGSPHARKLAVLFLWLE